MMTPLVWLQRFQCPFYYRLLLACPRKTMCLLQRKVRGYYNFIWERCSAFQGNSITNELPMILQIQVLFVPTGFAKLQLLLSTAPPYFVVAIVRVCALPIPCCRCQLAKVIHMSMLKESPILRDAPTQFFELLALKFTQIFAMPDEIIFR
jgi:hypothetical protein